MHEARENAAHAAWRFCQDHPALDYEAVRDLMRVIEPILAEGWQRAMDSPAIVNPDLRADTTGERPTAAPEVQTVAPDLPEVEAPPVAPPPPRVATKRPAPAAQPRPPRHSQQELERLRFEEW